MVSNIFYIATDNRSMHEMIGSLTSKIDVEVNMEHSKKLSFMNDDAVQAQYHHTRYNAALTKPASKMPYPIQIIRMKDLVVLLGLSRSTIYNKINPRSRWYDKRFPMPLRLGGASIGWLLADIEEWLHSLS
ncbi:helix-turn-helix transcriptional regulator [Aeromonas dhakensis]|uniref:helix-turn-helix transcriptional regulator n=1 Tax=Aeromonas dhakensis TaxID=196024 RepID=UPI003B9F6F73